MHCLLGDATSLFANLLIGYWPYSSIEGNPLIWSERQWVVIADTVAVDVSFRSVQHTWAACFVPHPSLLGSEQSTTSGSKKPIMWYWFQVERECRGWDNKLCLLFPSPAAPGDGISLKQAERKSLSALWMTSQRWERISLLPLSLGLCVCLSLSRCLSSLYSTRWLFFSGHKGVSLNPITPVLSLTNIKITPTTTTLRIFFCFSHPSSLSIRSLSEWLKVVSPERRESCRAAAVLAVVVTIADSQRLPILIQFRHAGGPLFPCPIMCLLEKIPLLQIKSNPSWRPHVNLVLQKGTKIHLDPPQISLSLLFFGL